MATGKIKINNCEGNLPVIQNLLNIICNATGMGFAVVAHVTDTQWITFESNDTVNFGLKPGDELPLETTICNRIRIAQEAVIINDVDEDPEYHDHQTPALYGFKSYISVPVLLNDGTFYGTLCAIDAEPNHIAGTWIVEMFDTFARIIGDYLSPTLHPEQYANQSRH